MIPFLQLFSSYREACIARIKAESDARHDRSRADRAEARVVELTEKLIEAHKSRRWSDSLPLEKPEHSGVPVRTTKARDRAAQIEAEARKNFDSLRNSNDAA